MVYRSGAFAMMRNRCWNGGIGGANLYAHPVLPSAENAAIRPLRIGAHFEAALVTCSS